MLVVSDENSSRSRQKCVEVTCQFLNLLVFSEMWTAKLAPSFFFLAIALQHQQQKHNVVQSLSLSQFLMLFVFRRRSIHIFSSPISHSPHRSRKSAPAFAQFYFQLMSKFIVCPSVHFECRACNILFLLFGCCLLC